MEEMPIINQNGKVKRRGHNSPAQTDFRLYRILSKTACLTAGIKRYGIPDGSSFT